MGTRYMAMVGGCDVLLDAVTNIQSELAGGNAGRTAHVSWHLFWHAFGKLKHHHQYDSHTTFALNQHPTFERHISL